MRKRWNFNLPETERNHTWTWNKFNLIMRMTVPYCWSCHKLSTSDIFLQATKATKTFTVKPYGKYFGFHLKWLYMCVIFAPNTWVECFSETIRTTMIEPLHVLDNTISLHCDTMVTLVISCEYINVCTKFNIKKWLDADLD